MTPPRPRAEPDPLFEVVLREPEIPNNTGNIGRTCVATACRLHLVHPLGFEVSEKACRRAGLDYWPRLRVIEHADWGAFEASDTGLSPRVWYLTTKAIHPVYQATLGRGDVLVFGKETAGLPDNLLAQRLDRCLCLPMAPGERSLNLAAAVCSVVYEGIRQLLAREELRVDAAGRLAW
jgi:tRNA (cytidine/uridine-2'-O-)-methyltransferase